MQAGRAETLKIFFSYAHEDEKLKNELEKHLSSLKRRGLISSWDKRDIKAGEDWRYEIDRQLQAAHVILLLISPDFIASDYCYSSEMIEAMKRHQAGETCVIPIVLRPVYLHDETFMKLQPLPRGGKPVTSWPNIDEAFLDIVTGIRERVGEHLSWQVRKQQSKKDEALNEFHHHEVSVLPAEQNVHSKTSIVSAYIDTGAALARSRQYEKSLEAYQQALLLDPYNALAHIGKGNALYNLKRYDEAGPAYHEAILLAPDNVLAYIGRGYALYACDYLDEALQVFEQAIRLDPTSSDAYNGKLLVLCGLERYKEVLIACNQLADLGLANAVTYRTKGVALHHRQRYIEALDAYEQAIRLNAGYAPAYAHKGNTLNALQRYPEALIAFEQALKLDSTLALAYNGKGNALHHLKQYTEALAAYEHAILLNPFLAVAHYNKGIVLERLGKSKEAKQAYKKARQLEIELRTPRR